MSTDTDAQHISFKKRVSLLYHGSSKRSRLFRYVLLTFDILTIIFFIFSSLIEHTFWVSVADFIIGIIIAIDFAARFWIASNRLYYMSQFSTWADLVVIFSLVAPLLFEHLIFLRVIRALRLLRSYHVLRDLRDQSAFFKRNETILQSVINLAVFIFLVTALVYVLQSPINPQINNYIDALYFTVTTLTTTGFGDITLQGSSGRLLAVLVMVVGVALFLRLVQTIFRPNKVAYDCPDCGLSRHDPDAVHCKHCGKTIKIRTEGTV